MGAKNTQNYLEKNGKTTLKNGSIGQILAEFQQQNGLEYVSEVGHCDLLYCQPEFGTFLPGDQNLKLMAWNMNSLSPREMQIIFLNYIKKDPS